jgi:hypothetical protein
MRRLTTALWRRRAKPIDCAPAGFEKKTSNKNGNWGAFAGKGEIAMQVLMAVGFLALVWVLVLLGSIYFNKNVV